jgi:hypothetical protein
MAGVFATQLQPYEEVSWSPPLSVPAPLWWSAIIIPVGVIDCSKEMGSDTGRNSRPEAVITIIMAAATSATAAAHPTP